MPDRAQGLTAEQLRNLLSHVDQAIEQLKTTSELEQQYSQESHPHPQFTILLNQLNTKRINYRVLLQRKELLGHLPDPQREVP